MPPKDLLFAARKAKPGPVAEAWAYVSQTSFDPEVSPEYLYL